MTGRGKAIAPLTPIAISVLSLTFILSFFLSLSPSSHPSVTGLHNNRVGSWRTFTPLQSNHSFQTSLSFVSFSIFQLLICFLSLHSLPHQSSQWLCRQINGTLWRRTIFMCLFCPSPPNSLQVCLNCFIAGAAANSVKAFMTISTALHIAISSFSNPFWWLFLIRKENHKSSPSTEKETQIVPLLSFRRDLNNTLVRLIWFQYEFRYFLSNYFKIIYCFFIILRELFETKFCQWQSQWHYYSKVCGW